MRVQMLHKPRIYRVTEHDKVLMFCHAAKLSAAQSGTGRTTRQVLETLFLGKFTSDIQHGRTVIATSEAGGSVSFSVPFGFSAGDVINVAFQGLRWLKQQTDPDAPDTLPRPIKRLTVSYANATL